MVQILEVEILNYSIQDLETNTQADILTIINSGSNHISLAMAPTAPQDYLDMDNKEMHLDSINNYANKDKTHS